MHKPTNSPCSTCPLAADETCTGFSNNEGTGRIPLMFVGDFLDGSELVAALPFRPETRGGSRLEAALRRAGRDRQEFTLTNVVRGRPHNNKLAGTSYEQTAIQNCRPYLIQTIEKAKPRVIVALGDIAYRALTGLYGRNTAISKVRGYFIWSKEFNCYVLPTFHPSFVVRGGDKLLPVLMADIKKALEVAEGTREVPQLGAYTYVRPNDDTSTAALREFVERVRSSPDLLIAYDIETSMSSHGTDEDQLLSIMRKDDDYANVLRSVAGDVLDESTTSDEGQGEGGDDEGLGSSSNLPSLDGIIAAYRNSELESIQFSLAPGTGIFIPYTREFIPIIAEILASPNSKVGHNTWIFDNPILRRNGFNIQGLVDDTLWMWHHSQPDQPASLQYVSSFFGAYGPWKHLSAEQPELYGCLDVDAVQRIMSQLPQDLRSMGIYDSYEKFVRDFHPILERMQDRGMRIDLERRDIFEVEVELATDEIDKTILANVPSELHGMHPPDGIKQWNGDLKRIRDEVMAEANSLIPKKKDWVKKFSDLHPVYQTRIQQRVTEELGDDYKWAEFSLPTGDIELRPYKVKLFNPNSTQQLMEYMKLRGIPIPKSLDGKATTGKKELERVAKSTKDIVLTNILELRKQRKVVSTYVQGWQVGGDSAVHTTFTFAPATAQLSSRSPNIQNVPKHGEFAKKFRECIVASPGCVLLEFDYKSFHMLTLGFCAGDAKYMRMARLDGHSYTASHLLKIPEAVSGKLDQMSDEEFKDYIKWFKSDSARKFVRDKKAKPTILGYGFGLGARKLYDMNIESFANQKEAQGVIDMLDRLFPLASKFREDIKQKAHRQKYLISPWGFIRRFNSVFVRDAKYGGWKGGDDAERAIAFLPANCAFGKIREAMIHLAEEGLDEKYRMTNTVHDSLVFDCPLEFRDEAIYKIKEIMERPGSVLIHPQVAPNGLSCEVEVSEGENWGNIVEVKL